MPRLADALERLLLTLWVGSLWGVGYLAVPVLFQELDSRQAGTLAGHMFTPLALAGLVIGLVLLALALGAPRGGRSLWRVGLLAAMLVLTAANEFWLHPYIATLRDAGIPEGSQQAAGFARLHGVSAVMYLATAIAGLVLAAAGVRPRRAAT